MSADARRRGEFDLIAEVLAPLGTADSRSLSFTDDAAVLPQRDGLDTVVTTDTMVAGVHFLPDEPADVVGRRLLRVNLSDLAAMGARPDAYFLNLTLPDDIGDRWLESLAAGLKSDQEQFGVGLLGGDTTRTPGPATLSITAVGEVPTGSAVTRRGAGEGDLVMVSGTIGDAGLGLSELRGGPGGDAFLIGRYQLPEPRVDLGQALRGIASAMADVSDGVAADLGHICAASGLAAEIDAAAVPVSAQARARLKDGTSRLADLLTSGDDYELVFALPAARRANAERAAKTANVEISQIGQFAEGAPEVSVRAPDGATLALSVPGFRHF